MEPRTPEDPKFMAHKVDMPPEYYSVKDDKDNLVSGLFKTVQDVGESVTRRDRVVNLAKVYYELKDYKITLGFSDEEIDIERGKKALSRGRFGKRVVQTDESGKSKLVRDNLYGHEEFEGHTYSYRIASAKEFPKLLDQKLDEEIRKLHEVLSFRDKQGKRLSVTMIRAKQVEELGDIYEIMDAIINVHNINMGEINSRLNTWDTVGKIIEKQPPDSNRQN